MKFEEYLDTLPKNLLSGEDVQLPEKSLREIFKFSNLGKNDIFFHLGCNNEKGIEIAINEFKVKKAIGIDNNLEKIQNAQNNIKERMRFQNFYPLLIIMQQKVKQEMK